MKNQDFKKYMEPSLYRILCVGRDASQELIKKTYRGLQKNFHPDVTKENADFANEKIIEINFAYRILSNPELKEQYDREYDKHQSEKKKKVETKKVIRLKLPKEKYLSYMPTYIISYDLSKEVDYSELIAVMKTFCRWWHYLDSTWIVRSNLTSKQIRDILGTYINKGDELFVGRMGTGAAWRGFSEKGAEWLQNNI